MKDTIIALLSITTILACFYISECRKTKELQKALLQTEILLLEERLNCKSPEVK